jgi:uncharacterized protein
MTERTSYAPGTPSWIDLGSPDTAGSAAFYGGLFGWDLALDARPEAGGYGLFTIGGKNVAGLGPQMNQDMPPFWAVYITVADVAESVAAATAAGGQVVAGPMDVLEAGSMAVLTDAAGSFISVWQPNQHIGAQLVNEYGTFTWNELATTDLATAQLFYLEVFGWQLSPEGGDQGGTIFTLGGEVLCGAHTATDGEFPAWSVWFSVEDCDASAAKVTELGGTVLMPPSEMGFGRGAVVADPQGAVFGIGTMNGPAAATAT